jgi:hypothetical protein
MLYRTNKMVVTAAGTSLTAAWDVERSADGLEWLLVQSLQMTAEAKTPIAEMVARVDADSLAVALRDRVVQELAVTAAAYYNERPIVLP